LSAAAAVLLSVVVPAAAPAATAHPDSGTAYTPVSPTRVFDSRTTGSKIPSYGTRSVAIPTGLVPADATAVVFNLTGTDPDGTTWLAVGPGRQGTATTSSLNLAAGETRANLVTVALGHGDDAGVWVGAGPNAVNAIVDVAGYYSPTGGSKYTSLTPQRVLDTRSSHPVGPGGTVTLDLSGQVPAGATAAVFNLTGTDVTGVTYVTAYPAGQPRPDSSNLNLVPGKDIPNLVTVRLSPDRKVSLTNNLSSVDLVVDLAGYYSPQSTQAFYPLLPGRVLDTRDANLAPRHPITQGQTRPLDVSNWVPAGATAAVVNLTGTDVTGNTVITVWADGAPQPAVSNLNLLPGQTSANAVVAPLSASRVLDLNNRTGQVDAIVDLAGYFAPALPACTVRCAIASGANSQGQAGDGTTDAGNRTDSLVYGLDNVAAIANTDQNGYALRGDGTLWAWGANDRGQLGVGTAGRGEGPGTESYGQPLPVRVLGNVKAIAAQMALTNDGTVYTWGANDSLQLGNGSTDTTLYAQSPTSVLTGAIAIAQSRNQNGGITRYAMKTNGTVWSWGDNSRGALGNHDVQGGASATPVQVYGLYGCTGLGVRVVLCPAGDSTQTVWRWGALSSGQQDSPAALPVPAGQIVSVQRDNSTATGARAILADGTVWQWPDGDGFTGVFDGAKIAGLSSITALANGVALGSDGTQWRLGSAPSVLRTGVSAIGDGSYYALASP
jgi:hypothetical protein